MTANNNKSIPNEKQLLKTLLNESIAKETISLLVKYQNDLCELLDIATIENDGIRPRGITNEVFSCFHHIVRGIYKSTDSNNAIDIAAFKKEADSAQRHLLRGILDCYKIILSSFLKEEKQLKETLAYLNLVEDFEKYIPDGQVEINGINNLQIQIEDEYKKAKSFERNGQSQDAVDHFNKCLVCCYKQRTKIKKFTKNKTYLLACARENRERKEKHKNRLIAIWIPITASILTVILTMLGNYIWFRKH